MIGNRKFNILLVLILGIALTIIFQHFTHPKTSVFPMSVVKSLISNITLHTQRKQQDQAQRKQQDQAQRKQQDQAQRKQQDQALVASKTTTTTTPRKPKVTVRPPRTKAQIFRWNHNHWEEWEDFCPSSSGFNVADLKTPAGQAKIFIHDLKIDKWVSGAILKSGSWEPEVINLIFHFMARDPDMHFLDIGSHVGQFSLMGAKMGRRVMAVDPLHENVVRLCSSIQQNKFSSLVKVFYNALSDTKSAVSFGNVQGDNLGATYIVKGNSSKSNANPGDLNQIKVVQTPLEFDKNTIQSVLLDDLLPFVTFKKAFMKIDVESHENYVLKGGEKFFKSVEIPYVFMEWVFHSRKPESAKQVIDFMKRHLYIPRVPSVENITLKWTDFRKWPENVLWVKDKPV